MLPAEEQEARWFGGRREGVWGGGSSEGQGEMKRRGGERTHVENIVSTEHLQKLKDLLHQRREHDEGGGL